MDGPTVGSGIEGPLLDELDACLYGRRCPCIARAIIRRESGERFILSPIARIK